MKINFTNQLAFEKKKLFQDMLIRGKNSIR